MSVLYNESFLVENLALPAAAPACSWPADSTAGRRSATTGEPSAHVCESVDGGGVSWGVDPATRTLGPSFLRRPGPLARFRVRTPAAAAGSLQRFTVRLQLETTAQRRVARRGDRLGPIGRRHKGVRAGDAALDSGEDGIVLAVVVHGASGRVRHLLHAADQRSVLVSALGGDGDVVISKDEPPVAVEEAATAVTDHNGCLGVRAPERRARWGSGGRRTALIAGGQGERGGNDERNSERDADVLRGSRAH